MLLVFTRSPGTGPAVTLSVRDLAERLGRDGEALDGDALRLAGGDGGDGAGLREHARRRAA